jgi:uncharacterized protein YcfJ
MSLLKRRPIARNNRLAAALTVGALLCGVEPAAIFAANGPPNGVEGNWSNVMYLGGALGVRGKSTGWDNTLTITPQTIKFLSKDSKIAFEIPRSSVRNVTFPGRTRANDGAVTAGMAAAFLAGALVGSQLKSTDYYAFIEYAAADGTDGGVLLRLHKDNHAAVEDAMRGMSLGSGDSAPASGAK